MKLVELSYLIYIQYLSVSKSSVVLLSLDFFVVVLAALGLRCCVQAFSSCSKWGATLCCGARALRVWASVVAAHGLSSCGTWALERVGFSSCGTWAQ